VRAQVLSIVAGCMLGAAFATNPLPAAETQERALTKSITWADTAALHARLEARGLTPASFPSYVERLRQTHAARVREGDLDHLIFYLLQSTGFTTSPSIEPALSAKALVEGMGEQQREAFLRTGATARSQVSADVRTRLGKLLIALGAPTRDPRLIYFGELIKATFPKMGERESGLVREYLRVMRFVYLKEFVAQRSSRPADAVADLYRSRGLSTDTAVEAGYVVSIGLGIVKSLEPDHPVRRVLIVGPGLDLAPRTALLEVGPPESYQPWAVIDALVSLGLARLGDLQVVAADINPRVVSHLRRAREAPPRLTLVSEIRDSETVTLSAEYRDYFARLGRAIADGSAPPGSGKPMNGHLRSTVRVAPTAARALDAERLDVVTDRLDGQPFDLVIATNILPYFDDGELMLALSNIAAMLAPGGVFLHNEARPLMGDVTTAVGLPFEHSRHVAIATVRGAPPLFDSVWLHRKAKAAPAARARRGVAARERAGVGPREH
jgi:SAM-dependent methyltransferase